MSKENKKTKFVTKDILKSSLIGAFQKLSPRYMIKNPVMFVVEIGFFIAPFSQQCLVTTVLLEYIMVW